MQFFSRISRQVLFALAVGGTCGASAAQAQTAALPQISVSDLKVKEGNSGLTDFVFNVSLSKTSATPITLTYKTVARTALAKQDFVNLAGTLRFAAGAKATTITVQVVGDAKAEENETFFLRLAGAKGATFRDNEALGTIVNDDGTPKPAPGSGKIVFVKRDSSFQTIPGLFIMNSDGTNLTRLSSDYNDTLPVWSPDGKKVGFRSYFFEGNFLGSGMAVIDANGANRRALTSDISFNAGTGPIWTGDSKALIYSNFYTNGIVKVPVNGDAPTNLTYSSYDIAPTASLVGKIAFASYDSNFRYQIFTIEANGSKRTQVTTDADVDNVNPHISADGKVIVYLKREFSANSLWCMNADGTNQKRIVQILNKDVDPTFSLSKDGKKAIFTAVSQGTATTYIADLKFGTIAETPSNGTDAVFSFDALRYVFTSSRDGDSEIFIINSNGTKEQKLTDNVLQDIEPDFTTGSVPAPATSSTSAAPVKAGTSSGSSANSS
jgi:Tol biopolymer transport system component